MKIRLFRNLLCLLLCVTMFTQIVPNTTYAKFVTDDGQSRCWGCMEWADADEICDDCSMHLDSTSCNEILHCPKCGACLWGHIYCKDCGLCSDCIEDGDDEHCEAYFAGCHYHGDVCDECHLCKEHEESQNFLCSVCGECCYNDSCPDGYNHCEDCGREEWGCPGCGECTYASDDLYSYEGQDWHIDCAIEEGILCWSCAAEETSCEECRLCETCITSFVNHCPICDVCYESVPECDTWGNEHCFNHCVLCEGCGFCYLDAEDELCDNCGLCPDCTTFCDICGECMSEKCSGACESGGSHCPACCEICTGCDRCVLATDEELCSYCDLCEDCCADNACPDCGLCSMYDDFENHKCENCGQCVPDEEPCEYCHLCVNCCEENSCPDCGMCVDDPDYNDHLCPECESCMGDNDPCEYCGLCENCCEDNGCSECGMCEKDPDFDEHVCEGCGSCTNDYDRCPDCGLCETCCMSQSECSDFLCVENEEYEDHFCTNCRLCFHDVIRCETCAKNGIALCVDCCESEGHSGVPGGTITGRGPEILKQPEDAHAVVSDVLCKNGVYKNYGIDPDDNYVSFSLKIANPYGASFKWQQKWTDGWHDLNEGERFIGTKTDTLTTQVMSDECINPSIYRCVITNHSGSTISNEVKIIADHYYNVWYAAEWMDSNDVPDGYHVLMCCGDGGCEEWKATTKAKHKYDEDSWTVLEEPTADKKGKMQGVCSVCGYKTVVETPMAHDHKWTWSFKNNYYVCSINGCMEISKDYECPSCYGYVPYDPNRTFAVIWIMDDSNPNVHYVSCADCRRTLYNQAHIFSEPEVIQVATENARGIARQTCGCGYEKNEYTPKLPHTHDFISDPLAAGNYGGISYNSNENNYKLQKSYNEELHWKICLKRVNGQICGHVYAQEAHHFVINTEKTSISNPVTSGQSVALICMQCGYEKTETVPSGESGYFLSIRNARYLVTAPDGTSRMNPYWAKTGETVTVTPDPSIGRYLNSWSVTGDNNALKNAGYNVNAYRQLTDKSGKLIGDQTITFTMGSAGVGLSGNTQSCGHNFGDRLTMKYNEKEHWSKCDVCGVTAIPGESHTFTKDANGISTCDVCGYYHYDVWLDGSPFDCISLKKTHNGGTAVYDPDSKTLQLNCYSNSAVASTSFPADITGLSENIQAMIYSPHDLTIELTGSSRLGKVALGSSKENGVAVFVDGNLTINGTGALSVNTKSGYTAYGLYATGDVTNCASVTFKTDKADKSTAEALYGIYTQGDLTNFENGILNVQTGHSSSANIALYADSVLNNGDLNTSSMCSKNSGFGIYAEKSVVTNGELSSDAYYGSDIKGYAIHAPQVKISGRSHLMGDEAVLDGVTSLIVDSGLIIEGSEDITDDWNLTAINQNEIALMKTVYVHGHNAYGVWIGQQQFTEERLRIQLGEGTATYSPKTGTLTLNNVVNTTMCDESTYGSSYGIYCDYDNALSPKLLTIELEGENTISLNGAYAKEDSVVGIKSNGLLLTGNGTLNIDIDTRGTDKSCIGMSCGGDNVNEAVLKMNLNGDSYVCGIEDYAENKGSIIIDAASKGSCYGFYGDYLNNIGTFNVSVTSTTEGEDAVAIELTDESKNSGKIIASAIGVGTYGIGIEANETLYNIGSIRASGTKQAILARLGVDLGAKVNDFVISGSSAFDATESTFVPVKWYNENYVLSSNTSTLAKKAKIAQKTVISGRMGSVGNPIKYMVKGDVPEGSRLIAARYENGRLVEAKIITAIVTDEEINTGMKVIDGSTYKIFLLDKECAPICEAWE